MAYAARAYKNNQHVESFDGKMTYKQGNTWISQLDWCIVSSSVRHCIAHFEILDSVILPTDHAPLSIRISSPKFDSYELLQRASQLGCIVCLQQSDSRKSVKFCDIDKAKFLDNIPPVDHLWSMGSDIDILCNEISECLYKTAVDCVDSCQSTGIHNEQVRSAHERWQRIINSRDPRQLWNSINWNGSFETPNDVLQQPTNEAFCDFYQDLLSPEGACPLNFQPQFVKYVPILDDPISPSEVADCCVLLKANKAAGIDGISPGLLKLLPDDWVIFMTYLFNLVFHLHYPAEWTIAKMLNIFKKGDRLEPTNYRGISIVVAMSKLYDMVLGQRFSLWYKPKYVQAGAQKGRSCTEQILTLRLLIDIARKKKRQLYITFID